MEEEEGRGRETDGETDEGFEDRDDGRGAVARSLFAVLLTVVFAVQQQLLLLLLVVVFAVQQLLLLLLLAFAVQQQLLLLLLLLVFWLLLSFVAVQQQVSAKGSFAQARLLAPLTFVPTIATRSSPRIAKTSISSPHLSSPSSLLNALKAVVESSTAAVVVPVVVPAAVPAAVAAATATASASE